MRLSNLLLVALLSAGLVAAEEAVAEKVVKVKEAPKPVKADDPLEGAQDAIVASVTCVGDCTAARSYKPKWRGWQQLESATGRPLLIFTMCTLGLNSEDEKSKLANLGPALSLTKEGMAIDHLHPVSSFQTVPLLHTSGRHNL